MITIVDYGLGNLASVRNALRAIGAGAEISSDPAAVTRASALVLPGVGAAGAGMERLRALGLERALQETAAKGVPILGICLGMQMLFDESDEGEVRCLGLIRGRVRLLRTREKVPQIGWNRAALPPESPLRTGVLADQHFYFVHSYVCDPADPDTVAARTTYGETFCSAVAHGSIWGTQFHPERSGHAGLHLLRHYLHTLAPGTLR